MSDFELTCQLAAVARTTSLQTVNEVVGDAAAGSGGGGPWGGTPSGFPSNTTNPNGTLVQQAGASAPITTAGSSMQSDTTAATARGLATKVAAATSMK